MWRVTKHLKFNISESIAESGESISADLATDVEQEIDGLTGEEETFFPEELEFENVSVLEDKEEPDFVLE